MTDITNEPDDQMSILRLLVYSNQLDVEGMVATTSTWTRTRVAAQGRAREVGDARYSA